jgi:acetyl-CoA synthetase
VTLNLGVEATDELKKELFLWVRKEIGPIASPDWLQWAPGLPKTRSGKILRSTIAKIANGEVFKPPATIDDPIIIDEICEMLKTIGYPKNSSKI